MPKTNKVEIDLGGASHGSVAVDGHNIAAVVAGLSLIADPGVMPTVTLALTPGQLVVVLDEAHIEIDEATRQLLLKLGWAPPIEGTDQ